MKPYCAMLLLGTALLSCAREDAPIATQEEPAPPGITIIFGRELNVGGTFSFVPLFRQDTVRHQELSSLDNLTIRVTETGASVTSATFTKSNVLMHCVTLRDSESYRPDNGCRIRGYGGGISGPTKSFFFELMVPAGFVVQPTQANGVLELQNATNDKVIVSYTSPWSSITAMDTLHIQP